MKTNFIPSTTAMATIQTLLSLHTSMITLTGSSIAPTAPPAMVTNASPTMVTDATRSKATRAMATTTPTETKTRQRPSGSNNTLGLRARYDVFSPHDFNDEEYNVMIGLMTNNMPISDSKLFNNRASKDDVIQQVSSILPSLSPTTNSVKTFLQLTRR